MSVGDKFNDQTKSCSVGQFGANELMSATSDLKKYNAIKTSIVSSKFSYKMQNKFLLVTNATIRQKVAVLDNSVQTS